MNFSDPCHGAYSTPPPYTSGACWPYNTDVRCVTPCSASTPSVHKPVTVLLHMQSRCTGEWMTLNHTARFVLFVACNMRVGAAHSAPTARIFIGGNMSLPCPVNVAPLVRAADRTTTATPIVIMTAARTDRIRLPRTIGWVPRNRPQSS